MVIMQVCVKILDNQGFKKHDILYCMLVMFYTQRHA